MVEATGSPTAYIASGLPPGLILDPVDGNLSGIPSRAGNYQAQVHAIYSDGAQAMQDYEFTVLAGAPESGSPPLKRKPVILFVLTLRLPQRVEMTPRFLLSQIP